jgi:DNA-binding GntR family transcriptional regulator
MTTSPRVRGTAVARLADDLVGQILAGRLAPGAALREEELARCYGVSRHVVREAILLVASQGLATHQAYKGARVSHIAADDVRDIYRARTFVEVGGLKRLSADACGNLARIHDDFSAAVDDACWGDAFKLDVLFHAEIVSAIDSKRMLTWHAELFQALSRAHLVRPDFQEMGLRKSVADHGEIVTALAAGNRDGAKAALVRHLMYSQKLLTDPSGQA